MLTRELSIAWLKFTLILSSGCLLFLIPYVETYRKKLNPEWLIKEQETKAIEAWKDNLEEAPKELKVLVDFIYRAYKINDYYTFEHGLRSFLSIPINSFEENRQTKHLNNTKLRQIFIEKISSQIIDIFGNTIKDSRAPFIVIDVLKNSLIEASNKGKDFPIPPIFELIIKGGKKSAETDNKELMNWISVCLESCTETLLINPKKYLAVALVTNIFYLVQDLEDDLKFEYVKLVYRAFYGIGVKASKTNNDVVLELSFENVYKAITRFSGDGNFTRRELINLFHLMKLCVDNKLFNQITPELLEKINTTYMPSMNFEDWELESIVPNLLHIGSELRSIPRNDLLEQIMKTTRLLNEEYRSVQEIIIDTADRVEDEEVKDKIDKYLGGFGDGYFTDT